MPAPSENTSSNSSPRSDGESGHIGASRSSDSPIPSPAHTGEAELRLPSITRLDAEEGLSTAFRNVCRDIGYLDPSGAEVLTAWGQMQNLLLKQLGWKEPGNFPYNPRLLEAAYTNDVINQGRRKLVFLADIAGTSERVVVLPVRGVATGSKSGVLSLPTVEQFTSPVGIVGIIDAELRTDLQFLPDGELQLEPLFNLDSTIEAMAHAGICAKDLQQARREDPKLVFSTLADRQASYVVGRLLEAALTSHIAGDPGVGTNSELQSISRRGLVLGLSWLDMRGTRPHDVRFVIVPENWTPGAPMIEKSYGVHLTTDRYRFCPPEVVSLDATRFQFAA